MTACDRQIRPLPTTLAALAALVAIMAATSALAEVPGFERQRGWVIRTLDGDEADGRAARQLTDCLARAARDLLGAPVHHLVAAIAPAPALAPAASEPTPRPARCAVAPPLPQVLIHHLALPPPLA